MPPVALFLVPFMCVWSGASLGVIYGTQIWNGQFNLMMSLFGIPFLLGSILFGGIALMTVCGKVELAAEDEAARIFTGIGSIGWTRRFDWSWVSRIDETRSSLRYSADSGMAIALDGKTRLTFGSLLNDTRRYYLLQSLRKLMAKRDR